MLLLLLFALSKRLTIDELEEEDDDKVFLLDDEMRRTVPERSPWTLLSRKQSVDVGSEDPPLCGGIITDAQ